MKIQRIGIFSGTFDPIHQGHLAFALAAAEQCLLDKVVFLPELRPRGKQLVTSLAHRVAMIALTIKDKELFEVITLDDDQFTLKHTLPQLQKMYAGSQLVYLCGSDVVKSFSTRWPGIELIDTLELAVGLRAGESELALAPLLSAVKSQAVHFVKTEQAHVSATQARAGNTTFLHPDVRSYIVHHNLY